MPPRKATGKRKAAATTKETAPSTPAKKTRQRRTEPSSTASTPTSTASSTASPSSSSSTTSSSSAAGSVYRLKVTLLDSSPPIWRTVRVHSSSSLHTLHLVLQILFDWEQCHMHLFGVPTARAKPDSLPVDWLYGPNDERRVFMDGTLRLFDFDESDQQHEDERSVTVGELLPSVGSRMVYEYDTGDSWDHLIEVEAIEPADEDSESKLPECTGGRYAAPPEDSGGMYRHSVMLRQYKAWKKQQKDNKKADKDSNKKGSQSKKRQQRTDEDDEEAESASDEGEDGDDMDTVEGWLRDSSERMGYKYDPLRFDKLRVRFGLIALRLELQAQHRS